MPFIIIIRHGWFIHWRKPWAWNTAQLSLIEALDARFLRTEIDRLIYAGKEPETRETASVLLSFYSTCSPPIEAAVEIEPSLRETSKDPGTDAFAERVIASGRSAIVVTHRKSIERIVAAIVAARGIPLNYENCPIPRRDQALVLDLDGMTATVHSRNS